VPRLNFIPSRDGWHFVNNFETRILPGISGATTEGLCGGMVMSALDYWRAGIPIPVHEPADLPADQNDNRLPDEASHLRRYIFDRQMNTFLTRGMITRWLPAPWLQPAWFHDWATNSEFEVVRQQLAGGRPTLLGLWGMENWNSGHQVLCYGFETDPPRLYVYDPNRPDEESILTPVSPERGVVIRGVDSATETAYRGYFFTDVYNWDEQPPYDPRYRDLVVTSGLNLDPSGPDAAVGGRLRLSVTVRNIGEYPARFRCMVIWARDPEGRNIDDWVGGIEPGLTALNPSEERTIVRDVSAFGQAAGTHTIGVARESNRGHWQDIPPGSAGTFPRRQLRLWLPRRQVVDHWIDVPEASRTDVDANVTLEPGDEYALQGTGSIWAGVWFTGLNGPEGWTDRIETNPSSPMHDVPQAHPFSLVGRFEGEPYFYVGTGFARRPYPRPTPRRLFLRINDNAPANGSGGFRCRVQLWR
jgi:hypothetical protein